MSTSFVQIDWQELSGISQEGAKLAYRDTFYNFLGRLPRTAHIVLLCNCTVDGLAAGALLYKILPKLGHIVSVRLIGKKENVWSSHTRELLAESEEEALIIVDLGTRQTSLQPGAATLVIDDHRPTGIAPGAYVISGYGHAPKPPSALLTHWCCQTVADMDALLWLTALSLLDELGEQAHFEEMGLAKRRFGMGPMRELLKLVRATHNCIAAFDLLLKAKSPEDAMSGKYPELDIVRGRVSGAQERIPRVSHSQGRALPVDTGSQSRRHARNLPHATSHRHTSSCRSKNQAGSPRRAKVRVRKSGVDRK
ncbi:MAG TPA: hypothetical protein VMZ27_17340 [Candidatus Saccharimonadales bacterium]|nr:hypothetical protein [Candidatus Saccharimonadales bacterium]